MTTYLVWPLMPEPVQLYTTNAFSAASGYVLTADSAENAARAGLSVDPSYRRFAVLGPEGITVIDLTPVDGAETLSLDEGPHR